MGVGVGAWFVKPTNKEKQKKMKKQKLWLFVGFEPTILSSPLPCPGSRPHYGTSNGPQ